ncbi:helix-turn-helix domain-containing protein [Nocardia cyriacigeorgica]|uniref:helix-turn-helix domain-containing protein n=1 Tax=Nocardia cyriacigeorgica TaxID=135487 RepID=UPI003980AE2C
MRLHDVPGRRRPRTVADVPTRTRVHPSRSRRAGLRRLQAGPGLVRGLPLRTRRRFCPGRRSHPDLGRSTSRDEPAILQRRLAEQGTTWRAEVQAARRDRAIKLLRDTDLPLGTVAARLGYSDTRTLRRSVNHWLDATPATLRYRPVEEPD